MTLTNICCVDGNDLAGRPLHRALDAQNPPAAVVCRVLVEGKRDDVLAVVAILVIVVVAEALAHLTIEALRLADRDVRHVECSACRPHAGVICWSTNHDDHFLGFTFVHLYLLLC